MATNSVRRFHLGLSEGVLCKGCCGLESYKLLTAGVSESTFSSNDTIRLTLYTFTLPAPSVGNLNLLSVSELQMTNKNLKETITQEASAEYPATP